VPVETVIVLAALAASPGSSSGEDSWPQCVVDSSLVWLVVLCLDKVRIWSLFKPFLFQ
jgi:hypothetical protein